MPNLVMLFSGGGTTMEQILFSCHNRLLNGLYEPVLLISSKKDAGGIARAINAGFPADRIVVCGRKQFKNRDDFGNELLRLLLDSGADVVLQTGWTCLTPENVVDAYRGKIFNQHPGPLDYGHPDFGGQGMVGLAVHQAVLNFLRETDPPEEEWYTEVVCHQVEKQYDSGQVIFSARVPVHRTDTAESLQARALAVEWAVQIGALFAIAIGTARPLARTSRVIKPGQEDIHERCKQEAIKMYPFRG